MLFILLHGWGSDTAKFDRKWQITEVLGDSGIRVEFPQRKGWPNWSAHDDMWVSEYVLQERENEDQIVLGGFSDGARTALRAAMLEPVEGLVFHSGRYLKRDVFEEPPPMLVCYGRNDWTAKLPWIGTNARELWSDYRNRKDTMRWVHEGGHEWGFGTNQAVMAFCEVLMSDTK